MTDIIDRSPMHNEEFFNKVADAMWLLMEQRVHKAVEEKIAALGNQLDDDGIDERISQWMTYNFCLDDYGFDIDDYSFGIDSMIDAQLQYQAEEGELQEWLSNGEVKDNQFEDKVLDVLRTNTIRIEI